MATVAALGVKTTFGHPVCAGWRPPALIEIGMLWIAGFVLPLILSRH